MKAVVVHQFGSFADATVADLPIPPPATGAVIIKVDAAPVNFVDLIVISGKYQFLPKLPFTPGKGPSGVVHAVGQGVDGLKVGDRVLAMAELGGYAEYCAVSASQCYRLPDGLSLRQAAAMSLTFDTSWFALRDRARIQPGETVLVMGATGGVGGASVQLAKAMGARVLAGVSNVEKAQHLKAFGADAIIDLSRPDLRDSLRTQVHEHTNGRGVDVVVDPLGGDYFDAALRALAWCGRLVVVGFAAGRIPSVKANYLLLKNIEVTGLQVSDYRKRRPDQMLECYREIFSFLEKGQIAPIPVTELPLAEFKEGLHRVETRNAFGRVLLIPPHCAEKA